MIKLFTDASFLPNFQSKNSRAGIIIVDDLVSYQFQSQIYSSANCNHAEYLAMALGIKWAKKFFPDDHIITYNDNVHVVHTIGRNLQIRPTGYPDVKIDMENVKVDHPLSYDHKKHVIMDENHDIVVSCDLLANMNKQITYDRKMSILGNLYKWHLYVHDIEVLPRTHLG